MKTIEEAAKEQANALKIYSSKQDFEKGFKTGVECAQRWIPVEEELPTEDGKYLVRGIFGTFINQYNDFHKCWDDEDGDDYSSDLIGGKITHWRPIELK